MGISVKSVEFFSKFYHKTAEFCMQCDLFNLKKNNLKSMVIYWINWKNWSVLQKSRKMGRDDKNKENKRLYSHRNVKP